jgi:hypothetical protein
MRRPRPLIAATLIVRDEAAHLPDCLASVRGVVDEIVVYDTGSVDGTPELARAAGARVLQGYWDDDFARARNAALEMTRAHWVLIIDADERLVADASGLRALLQDAPSQRGPMRDVDCFLVEESHLGGEGVELLAHQTARLVRADRYRWEGRVHERLASVDGAGARHLLPAGLARLEHRGYGDAATVRAKAERNLTLCQAVVDDLVATACTDVDVVGPKLFDLARSFIGVGRTQDAVDALETIRELTTGGVCRAMATACLAQVLLDHGGFEQAALVLEADLRAGGVADPRQADWIRAQALGALGHGAEALDLLRRIDAMVDPLGNPQPMARFLRARAILANMFGCADEARRVLLSAVTEHAAVRGNGPLLVQLFNGREEELVGALRERAGHQLEALAAELNDAGVDGAALAGRLTPSTV